MSDYRMQIFHIPTGKLATWKPGSEVETDIIEELCDRLVKRGASLFRPETSDNDIVNDLCDRLVKRGVGFFRSEATVLAAVKQEVNTLLSSLNGEERGSVVIAVREELSSMLWDLKSKIR